MYFYWQQKIRAISNQERLRLLVGKIRLDELASHPAYVGRVPVEKIIEYYKLS
jgi:hypothetical protein